MTSPICTVADGGGAATATTNGVDVVDNGGTVTIALADVAGVNVWSITVVGEDESVAVPTLTVNNTNKTATFTKPAGPWALIFQSKVNSGNDINGKTVDAYTTTFGVYCQTTGGARLFASSERSEGSASFGWITKFNAILRGTAGVAGGSAIVHAGVSDTNYTVTESAGVVYVGFKSLSAARLLNIPAAATANKGLRIIARSEDNTLTDVNTITWTPVSGNIERANTSAATFVMTKTIVGTNGSLEFISDGSVWRALS